MATSRTSIVGLKFKSSVAFGIDSRMCLSEYTTIVSNLYRKTVIIRNGKQGKDELIVFVGFSGDTPLLPILKRKLPGNKELKENLSTLGVAEWVKGKADIELKKEAVGYGIVVMGIGETGDPEMFLVESVDWKGNEKSLTDKRKMNTTLQSIEKSCVAGTGATWLQPFLDGRRMTYPGEEFPAEMQLNDVKDLVLSALKEAIRNDPDSGGLLQVIVLTNEDGFRCFRYYQRQKDYDWCGMPYEDWPVGKGEPEYEFDESEESDY